MLVKLHRFQPKSKRYVTQTFDLADESKAPYLDLVCGIGDAIKTFSDPTSKQTIARTMAMTRVYASLDARTGQPVTEIFMQPIKERNYPAHQVRSAINSLRDTIHAKRPKGCICVEFELMGEHGERCPSQLKPLATERIYQ